MKLRWCAKCRVERAPLEDGTCGWCGKSNWLAQQPAPPKPVLPPEPSQLPRRLVVKEVAEALARERGVTLDELRTPNRHLAVACTRQKVMADLRRLGASYPEIGCILDRHHTTVLHGCRQVSK